MLLLLLACTGVEKPEESSAPPLCGVEGLVPGKASAYPKDTELHMGMLQARGTHNSYHIPTEPTLDDSWDYTQPPLTEQLRDLGVRQIELDLHLREDGGLEVFHIPVADPGSTCLNFEDCLREVCSYSVQNPDHAPILIWMEPKDELDAAAEGYQPILGHYADIESVILSVLPPQMVYTPDDWRRGAADLATASATLGPPTLAEVRGKVLFGLLDSSEHRDAYLTESPDLAGRLLFPDSALGLPYAALVKDAGPEEMPQLVAAGLVVTTNVDGAGNADNIASRDAALAGGVHYAATDFPAPSADYWMELPGGEPVRCNPLTAPPDCVAAWIE